MAKPKPPCDPATDSLQLSAPASAWKNTCLKVSLTVNNSSGTQCSPPTSDPVSLSISPMGQAYSDVGCSSSPITSVSFPANGERTFYVKLPFGNYQANNADLQADLTGLSPALHSFSVGSASASAVLGQSSYNANQQNSGGLGPGSLSYPYSITKAGNKLIVADTDNHRVLIWNSIPNSQADLPSVVLGQPDFASSTPNNGGISAGTLDTPTYVHSDGTRLFVADLGNQRVLIWNQIPTSNFANANLVLGQPDFTSSTPNNGGVSGSSLRNPNCAFVSGTRLFVCDTLNHRVLQWNKLPRSNGEAADRVLGQPNFTSSTPAMGANGMNLPYFARVLGSRLYVSDFGNSRVLVWTRVPNSNGKAANFVLGQPDFTSSAPNNGGPNPSSLSGAGETGLDAQGRFYVSDYGNSRILLWNQVPGSNGAPADSVIGQKSMHQNNQNQQGPVSASGLSQPWGLEVSGSELWTVDYMNHRVLKFVLP